MRVSQQPLYSGLEAPRCLGVVCYWVLTAGGMERNITPAMSLANELEPWTLANWHTGFASVDQVAFDGGYGSVCCTYAAGMFSPTHERTCSAGIMRNMRIERRSSGSEECLHRQPSDDFLIRWGLVGQGAGGVEATKG